MHSVTYSYSMTYYWIHLIIHYRRAQLKKQVSVTFLPGLLTRKETKIFKLPRIQRSLRTYIINTIDQLSDCWQVNNYRSDIHIFLPFFVFWAKNKEDREKLYTDKNISHSNQHKKEIFVREYSIVVLEPLALSCLVWFLILVSCV